MRMTAKIAAAGLAAALAVAGCSTVPSRMSVPQKVDVGTTAWCQTLAHEPIIDPGDSAAMAMARYIITPASGHDRMGLPIEGTRLEADVLAARADNGTSRLGRDLANVLADCRYILARSH